jgi:hypothetical protein
MVFFSGSELRSWLDARRRQAVEAVAHANVESVRFSPEEVTESILERYALQPVTYDWDNWSADAPREVTIDGQQFGSPVRYAGQSVTIHVPVSGDAEVLSMQASTHRMDGGFQGSLDTHIGEITFTITDTSMSSDVINQRAESMRADLEERTGWTNHDVAQWLHGLRAAVLNAAYRRKQQLDAMAETSAGLSIPLRSAPGAQQVQVPVVRKTMRVAKRAPIAGGDAEPALSNAIYEDVIRTVRALANSMERLPRTARRFKEEEFRDLILFVLNSNYEGLARGEVFNGEGKTDILLPYQDANAFIGECKFWKGPRLFKEAIDQLLGYTVWRDTKAALLLFIKTGDATSIIAKADAALRDHPCFVSTRPAADSSHRSDFLMHAVDDSSRHIKVALLPVVIRQPEDTCSRLPSGS